MPDPAQTPASRRFIQPSSSSTKHRSHLPSSSSHRTPFARPSQPSSSSPFARTPFSKQARDKDDIETSFEEEIALPSEVPPPITISSSVQTQRPNLHGDYIEDDFADHFPSIDSAFNQGMRSNTRSAFEQHTPPRSDSLVPSPGKAFSSPLPKRQKTSHPQVNSNVPIEVSSSPSPSGDDIAFSDSELEDTAAATAAPINIKDQDITPRHDLENTTRPRFRHPTSTADTSRDRIPNPTPKPLSRNIFRGVSMAQESLSESPLPATFSPSRRRGKTDYIYNGSAETVRRWILNLAAEQSQTTGTEQADTIKVTPVLRDQSERFRVVEEVDTKKLWMLVGQSDETRRAGSGGSNTRMSGGGAAAGDEDETMVRSIVVKGRGSTTWEVPCPDTATGQFELRDTLNVAVLWQEEKAKR